MSASIEHSPRNGEEQCGDHSVGKHLQHCSRDTERVCRSQTNQHETHMAHARITNNEFQITLAQSHRRRVNNSDHGQGSDPFAPYLESFWKDVHRDAQSRIGAQFHHDAGKQHRPCSGRRDVACRSPGMQWPDAGKHSEAEEQHRKGP